MKIDLMSTAKIETRRCIRLGCERFEPEQIEPLKQRICGNHPGKRCIANFVEEDLHIVLIIMVLR